MKPIRFLGFLPIFVIVFFISCSGSAPIKGSADVDLSNASVDTIYPSIVLPGTLVSIQGRGFGSEPGLIYLNGEALDRLHGWEENIIWFRVPRNIDGDIEVQVGSSIAPDKLLLAPKGSITVHWALRADQVQDLVDDVYGNYGLNFAPEWQFPVYLKGQWIKQGSNFGMKSEEWDGGSRILMWKEPNSETWISETVFTPEQQESFGNRPMLFAFEDENQSTRNLSAFESDIAYILKREWADQDSHYNILSDPAVLISTNSDLYVQRRNAVEPCFPPQ